MGECFIRKLSSAGSERFGIGWPCHERNCAFVEFFKKEFLAIESVIVEALITNRGIGSKRIVSLTLVEYI